MSIIAAIIIFSNTGTNMADSKQCFIPVMLWEGFRATNISSDYGGYTLAGISQKYWPDLDLWKMNINEYDKVAAAIESFYTNVWRTFRMSEITNNKVALQIFQAAFNCWGNAIRWAQEVCNEQGGASLDVDGIIGEKTITAINSMSSFTFRKYFFQKQSSFYNQRKISALMAKDALDKKSYFNDSEKEKFEMEARQLDNVAGWIARAEYFAR